MNASYLAIYDLYFPEFHCDWRAFNRVLPSKYTTDFEINEEWAATARSIAIFLLKVIIFPWGLYELSRFAIQRLIMLPLYPAQNSLVKYFLYPLGAPFSNIADWHLSCLLDGHVVRALHLKRNGVGYQGLLIGQKEHLSNGHWVIHAVGNCQRVDVLDQPIFRYLELGMNVLLINGPGVGLSEGIADGTTVGEAQELGLSFLEGVIKATHIVMSGFSLGGAAMSQAIMQHDFKENVKYLALREMTFDRVSHICGEIANQYIPYAGFLIEYLVRWAGCEMDNVAASKRLSEKHIKEVIIQATNKGIGEDTMPKTADFAFDGVIPPQASLGYRLIQEGVTENKVFISIPFAKHNDPMSPCIEHEIRCFVSEDGASFDE